MTKIAVVLGRVSTEDTDRVIETMRQTGVDMQAKYKETSLGGLAVTPIGIVAETYGLGPVIAAVACLPLLGAVLMRLLPRSAAAR